MLSSTSVTSAGRTPSLIAIVFSASGLSVLEPKMRASSTATSWASRIRLTDSLSRAVTM